MFSVQSQGCRFTWLHFRQGDCIAAIKNCPDGASFKDGGCFERNINLCIRALGHLAKPFLNFEVKWSSLNTASERMDSSIQAVDLDDRCKDDFIWMRRTSPLGVLIKMARFA